MGVGLTDGENGVLFSLILHRRALPICCNFTPTNGNVGKSNKLEKADILEMTVDFVKRSHPVLKEENENVAEKSTDSVQYKAGYEKCRNEIQNFLQTSENMSEDVKSTLLRHLQYNARNKSSESTDARATEQDIHPKSNATPSFANILPRVQSAIPAVPGSSASCHTTSQPPGNRNVFICNPGAPAYVLVPTATLCQSIPVNSQMTQTHDSPLNLVKSSRTQSEIVPNSPPQTTTMQLGSVVNGNQFVVIPQGNIPQVPNFMASSVVGGQSNVSPINAIQNLQGNFVCMPNLQMSLSSSQSDQDVWRPW
ncbi:transcription factor HES-1-like isoform X2 [Ostrea edulis]|uniref:transcription factor HES-1-like isoform X2 n=1 Tax=Ostrea edulis TaxID=37623 RepID=UPI0024AF39A4|nr:transcription factor HES-1-like isoform X2 [Ostrea edulis]